MPLKPPVALRPSSFPESVQEAAFLDRLFVVAILRQTLDLGALDRHRAFVLVNAAPCEHPHIHHRAGHSGRQLQRRIAYIRRLLAEDRAQQFFFRRHRAFALRRNLADQDVTRVHLGADVYDAGLVEVLQRFLAHVGDVARDLLLAELGVARHHLEFLDVDGREHVVARDALADQDEVLEVVAVPRHEGDQHIAAERQFAEFGRNGPSAIISPSCTRSPTLTNGSLIDAGGLVGAHELAQPIDVDALGRVVVVGRAHHDARAVDLVHDASPAGNDRCTAVTCHCRLHAGADQRRVGLDERHRLTLHVGAHQRAIGVAFFSRNGMSAAATETSCFGDTSIAVTSSGRTRRKSPCLRTETRSSVNCPVEILDRRIGLGDDKLLLLHCRKVAPVAAGPRRSFTSR